MDLIVGGMLVFSLFSANVLKIDFISYEVNRTQRLILSKLEYIKNANDSYSQDDVNDIIETLDINFTKINKMLIEKNSLRSKIASTMEYLALKKTRLDHNQIRLYKEYNDMSIEEEKIISSNLALLKGFNSYIALSNGILSESDDYSDIYQKLDKLNAYQINVISSLRNLIHKSNNVLAEVNFNNKLGG